jgi:hypothetical protein
MIVYAAPRRVCGCPRLPGRWVGARCCPPGVRVERQRAVPREARPCWAVGVVVRRRVGGAGVGVVGLPAVLEGAVVHGGGDVAVDAAYAGEAVAESFGLGDLGVVGFDEPG